MDHADAKLSYCNDACRKYGRKRPKHCLSCGKQIQVLGTRYCNEECLRKTWERNCVWCQKLFIPTERRVYFCTRSCAGKWKMSQPALVKSMIAGKDLEAAGKAISRGIARNPNEHERRSKNGKKQGSIMALRNKKIGKGSYFGYGIGHDSTPAEIIVGNQFPEAVKNLCVPTGESSKLGNPHVYYLDFAWPHIKLDVEIDGAYHNRPEQIVKDGARDSFLKSKGWVILRFKNKIVLKDSSKVIAMIKSKISELSK